jgi:hypothetical protein
MENKAMLEMLEPFRDVLEVFAAAAGVTVLTVVVAVAVNVAAWRSGD